MLIEGELEDAGVKAKCSYAKQEAEVEYDEKKVTENDIKKVIEKAGYGVS
jgi:copper chaperone CopZ